MRDSELHTQIGLSTADDSLDIDELFGGSRAIEEPSATQGDVKNEPISPAKPKIEQHSQETKPKIEHASQEAATRPKPKPGRLVSNEQPLEDFNRLVQGEGDVFRKAVS